MTQIRGLAAVGLLLCGCSGAPGADAERSHASGEPVRSADVEAASARAKEPGEAVREPASEAVRDAASEAVAVPGPLSAEQRAALLAGGEERIISRREHFTVSNEYRHDLWFPYLSGLGGAYVGVASDQNYTLMAVAQSEVGYLIDLDRQVVLLHRVYMALIAASETPEQLLARFDPAAQGETTRLIEAGLSDMSERDRAMALEFVANHRAALREYLGAVHANRRDGRGVTWLAEPSLYRHVRAMVAGGRLRPINGNLAGKTAMATIAASAAALGLEVEVFYLSNAEEYLSYTPGFVANVRGLPASSSSVVLRTIHDRFAGWESCGEGDRRWNYQVQPLVDFQARLADRMNTARTAMLARAGAAGVIDRVARGVSVFKKPGAPVASSAL